MGARPGQRGVLQRHEGRAQRVAGRGGRLDRADARGVLAADP